MSNLNTARVDHVVLASRVAQWRRERGYHKATTTGLVSMAARGMVIPRNKVEALRSLPVRHGR